VAVELHPGFWLAHYYLGLAHAQQEDFEAAIAGLHVACDLSDASWVWEGVGHTLAMAGRTDEAEATLARLREIAARQYVSPYSHAVILGALGRIDDAFDWLEKAIEARAWRIAWLSVDPLLDPLRADARFDALQARLLGPAARP
jgi:tetratricopeptide (TPR) repeat protein